MKVEVEFEMKDGRKVYFDAVKTILARRRG